MQDRTEPSELLDVSVPVSGKLELKNLSCFEPNRLLSENYSTKQICVEGRFKGSDQRAVVIFEQNVISEDDVKELLSDETKLELTFENDIYRNYKCFSKSKNLNGIKTTVIYPASEDDIKKYQLYPTYIVYETSELYCNVTLPYIERVSSKQQWIYDILEGRKEQERILFDIKCPEFGGVVVPHLNWDQKDVDDLHLVAIVRRRGIKSLRDLNFEHIPLLESIRAAVFNFIKEKYSLPGSQVVVFLHYLPSYYHLHIHFANLKCGNAGTNTEEAYLLSEIIENIGFLSDYYQKATIPFIINESIDLFFLYKEKGLIEEKVVKESQPFCENSANLETHGDA